MLCLHIWKGFCYNNFAGKAIYQLKAHYGSSLPWKQVSKRVTFCVEKQGKYHDLLPILSATFPMGDWNRARASDLVFLSLEQKCCRHFGFLISHFDLFSLATLCQKLNLFLKDERNKNFMGIGLQNKEITTSKEVQMKKTVLLASKMKSTCKVLKLTIRLRKPCLHRTAS